MKKKTYNVAVLGATGVVGREVLEILEQRKFPLGELRLFATERSRGEKIRVNGQDYGVEVAVPGCFKGIDIVMGDTPTAVSRQLIPLAVKEGALGIDCSSAFRMEKNVPLVIPEVNPEAITPETRLIAGANCSAIPIAVAVKPLMKVAGIKRLVASTYQSVSGAGKGGSDELAQQTVAILNQGEMERKVFAHQIAFNCIPHIDKFNEDGTTKEESKIIDELRKMLSLPDLKISVTAVRVPVFCGHSVSLNVELDRKIGRDQARELFAKAPGIKLVDDPSKNLYPIPTEVAGTDDVFVGRIREDPSVEHGLNIWLAADNLRKGAALNAVQIAELLIQKYL